MDGASVPCLKKYLPCKCWHTLLVGCRAEVLVQSWSLVPSWPLSCFHILKIHETVCDSFEPFPWSGVSNVTSHTPQKTIFSTFGVLNVAFEAASPMAAYSAFYNTNWHLGIGWRKAAQGISLDQESGFGNSNCLVLIFCCSLVGRYSFLFPLSCSPSTHLRTFCLLKTLGFPRSLYPTVYYIQRHRWSKPEIFISELISLFFRHL